MPFVLSPSTSLWAGLSKDVFSVSLELGRGLKPVFNGESGHPGKFAFVRGDQDGFGGKGVRSDQHVIRPDGCSRLLQVKTKAGVFVVGR